MTALCGGGTSAPKLGTDLIAQFSTARLTQLAVLRGMSWTSPWLALISLLPIGMTAFCGSDPPAIVTLTTNEIDALVNLTIGGDLSSGLDKIKNMLLNAIWQDLCECTSGTFTAPTYPAPVAGTPIPQLPQPAATDACATFLYTSAFCDTGNLNKGGGPTVVGKTITSVLLHMVGTRCGGPTTVGTFNWVWTFLDSGGLALGSVTYSLAGTTTFDVLVNCPVGTQAMRLNHNQVGGGDGQTVTGSTYSFYCNGSVPGVQSPCCPPDTATSNQLELILKMVTLIQRQNAPFSYIASTAHTAISGAGSITIQGLLGAKVDVTTLPSSYGRAGTSPTEFFDLGFLSFGTPDGWPSSYRLDHDPMLMFPQRCGLYTTLSYDLAPGVVVTITELLREP